MNMKLTPRMANELDISIRTLTLTYYPLPLDFNETNLPHQIFLADSTPEIEFSSNEESEGTDQELQGSSETANNAPREMREMCASPCRINIPLLTSSASP